ncbi:MAG: hypothetical protein IJZ09_03000 [Tidjanibacter sp.]|nr:hypothetical protein [Tidjanibacter sp.]
MKKLIALFGILCILVGCGDFVEDESINTPTINGFVPGGEQNLLPYPIGLDHTVVNEKGENVWQYFYDHDATSEEDFQYLVNISMYCNADEDFDFLNNPTVFGGNWGIIKEEDNNTEIVVGDYIKPIPSYTTPYFWAMYYCVFSRGSHPEYYHKQGYRYEMHFPLLFPTAGKYVLQLNFAQPVELDKPDHPEVHYAYRTDWFTIKINEDNHDDGLPMCGGKVTIAKGYNASM